MNYLTHIFWHLIKQIKKPAGLQRNENEKQAVCTIEVFSINDVRVYYWIKGKQTYNEFKDGMWMQFVDDLCKQATIKKICQK